MGIVSCNSLPRSLAVLLLTSLAGGLLRAYLSTGSTVVSEKPSRRPR